MMSVSGYETTAETNCGISSDIEKGICAPDQIN